MHSLDKCDCASQCKNNYGSDRPSTYKTRWDSRAKNKSRNEDRQVHRTELTVQGLLRHEKRVEAEKKHAERKAKAAHKEEEVQKGREETGWQVDLPVKLYDDQEQIGGSE